jgi:hypothetical protein
MSRSIRGVLGRRSKLARWSATGATVVALAVAVPIVASAASGPAAAPELTGADAAAFITASGRPIVPGTLSETSATTTGLGTVSLWTYRVADNGQHDEVMLSLPDHPLAFGQCPSTGSAAFCIAALEGPGSPLIVAGTAGPDAAHVVASYADGTTVSEPVHNDSWIMQLPGGDGTGAVPAAPRSFTTYDAGGGVIGASDLGIPSLIADHNRATR